MWKAVLIISLLITVTSCAPQHDNLVIDESTDKDLNVTQLSENNEIVSIKKSLDKKLHQLYDAYQVEKSIHDQTMEELEKEVDKIRKKQHLLSHSISQDRKTLNNLTKPEVIYPENYLTERINEEIKFQQGVHKKISECYEKYERNCNHKYQHELTLSAELVKLFKEKEYLNTDYLLSFNLLSMDIEDSLNEFYKHNDEMVPFFEKKRQLEAKLVKLFYQYKINYKLSIKKSDDKIKQIVSKDLEWIYRNKTFNDIPSHSVTFDNDSVIIRDIIKGVIHYGNYSPLNKLAVVYGDENDFETQEFDVRHFKLFLFSL